MSIFYGERNYEMLAANIIHNKKVTRNKLGIRDVKFLYPVVNIYT